MPEGDVVYRSAVTLGKALRGRVAGRVEGTSRAMRDWGTRLSGRRVVEVESAGKHLLVHFDGGLSIRTHLGMPGAWHIYKPGERFRRSPGAARVVIHTDDWVGVCFSAPTVQAGPTAAVLAAVEHLGPDLTAETFDVEVAAERARRSPAATLADLLLDQRVMAGVGNVFKSEVLFLERLHPLIAPGGLDGGAVEGLVRRSRRLLLGNREGGPRVTTGRRSPGGDLWVYGRTGRPCRRCGTPIDEAWLGDPARITYWCPSCQPPPPEGEVAR